MKAINVKFPLMEVNKVITTVIEILNRVTPKAEIKLASNTMYRLPPTEYAKAGEIVVDIEIKCGRKRTVGVFSYALAEEIVMNPYGKSLAEDYVHGLIKKVNDVH